MSVIDASVTETEVDKQIENLRRRCDSALQRRLSDPACLSPATLIRILNPVIEKYLSAGLMLEEIAKALQEEGFSITKGHLVRHLGTIRAENGLPPLKRGNRGNKAKQENEIDDPPAARGGREQKESTVAAVVLQPQKPQAPTPAPTLRPAPATQPRPLPGEKRDDERPRWISEEMWAMKPKIDKILKTYPAADREYPELVDARFWTDKNGKKWNVLLDEKPNDEKSSKEFDLARIRYYMRWRGLMERWGLMENANGEIVPRYDIAEEYQKPLLVNLDEIIAKHLD